MLPYLLACAIPCGILASLIACLNAKDEKVKHARNAFLGGAAGSLALMWLAIVLLTPTFAHWSDWGYTIGFYLVLVAGVTAGSLAGYNHGYRASNQTIWLSILLVSMLGIGRIFPVQTFQMGIGPNPCSLTATQTALNRLLPIQEGITLEELRESGVEKVSDERSLALARNAQPQNLQLGEYLTVMEGYEQLINGRPMNVHPMKAKDRSAYRRFGNKTPGYLLVDASRSDGQAQWIQMEEGDEIVYIYEDAPWRHYNLTRYVYYNYELPRGVQVWDLQGPEVSDELDFWYVGTVMKPSEAGGARYYMPVGIITIDPHNGEITEYTPEEAREKLPWLDRLLPVEAATNLVSDYAKYQDNAAICNWFSNSGQWEVDTDPILTTRGGEQVMQFFVTTRNSEDPIVQETIYVSPVSMKAYRFPGNGMLVDERTRALVEKRANPNLKPENYSVQAKEPTHMWFGGQQFMVYVLERGTTFVGFGAIRSDLARKENDQFVVLGTTIGELSRRANEQNARILPGSLDNQAAEEAFELRVTGIVDYISPPYMDAGDIKVIFTVREEIGSIQDGTEESTIYIFRASSRLLAEELVDEGHLVTVTGQAVSEDPSVVVDITAIVNDSYPATSYP